MDQLVGADASSRMADLFVAVNAHAANLHVHHYNPLLGAMRLRH